MLKFTNKRRSRFKVSHPYKNLIASLFLGIVVFFTGVASAMTGFFGLNSQIKSYALTGQGTSASPYSVSTGNDLLEAMRKSGTVYIDVNNDIALLPASTVDSFKGVLNGNGHTITLNSPLVKNNEGTIKNIKFASGAKNFGVHASFVVSEENKRYGVLEDLEIISNYDFVTVNSLQFGAFAKINKGTIERVINNQSFDNSRANSEGTAGVVVENHSIIKRAINFGDIFVSGKISTSLDNGRAGVAAGLVAVNYGSNEIINTIENSYNAGNIHGANAVNPTTNRKGYDGGHAGGIVGILAKAVNFGSQKVLSQVVNYGDVYGGNGSKGADGEAGKSEEWKDSDSAKSKSGKGGKGGYAGGNGGHAGGIIGAVQPSNIQPSTEAYVDLRDALNFGLVSPGFGGDGGNGGGGSGAGFKYTYSNNGKSKQVLNYTSKSGNGQLGGNGMVIEVAVDVGITTYGSGGGGAGGRAGFFGLSSDTYNLNKTRIAEDGKNGTNAINTTAGKAGESSVARGKDGSINRVKKVYENGIYLFAPDGGDGGYGEKILDVLSSNNTNNTRKAIARKNVSDASFKNFDKNVLEGWVKIGDRYELAFEDSEREISLDLNFALDGNSLHANNAKDHIKIEKIEKGVKSAINLSETNTTISSKAKLVFTNTSNHAFNVKATNGKLFINKDNAGLFKQTSKELVLSLEDYVSGNVELNINLFSGLNGNGTEINPYQIANEEEFKLMQDYINNFESKELHFKMQNSFTVQSNDSEILVDNFKGVLNGNGYTITLENNLKTLFGTNAGIVKNLNVVVSSGPKISSSSAVFGFIANKNSGTINNIILSSEKNNLIVMSYNHSLGMLVGENAGVVENSRVQGDIRIVTVKDTSENLLNIAGAVAINTNEVKNIENRASIVLDVVDTTRNVVFGGLVASSTSSKTLSGLAFRGGLIIDATPKTTIGLLVGKTNGNIEQSYTDDFDGEGDNIQQSYTNGVVIFVNGQQDAKLGFLVGEATNNPTINEVYAKANVFEVENPSRALDYIISDEHTLPHKLGTLVAEGNAIYSNAYISDTIVNEQAEHEDVVILTGTEINNARNFDGFDFLKAWYAAENGAPKLFVHKHDKLTVNIEIEKENNDYGAKVLIPALDLEEQISENQTVFINPLSMVSQLGFEVENPTDTYITVSMIVNGQETVVAGKADKATKAMVKFTSVLKSTDNIKVVAKVSRYEYTAKFNTPKLNTGESVSSNNIGQFSYIIDNVNMGSLNNQNIEELKLGSELVIVYNDAQQKTLSKVSEVNTLYFTGIKLNDEILQGNREGNQIRFTIVINDQNASKFGEPIAYTPIFEKLFSITVKSHFDDDVSRENLARITVNELEGEFESINAIAETTINLTAEIVLEDITNEKSFNFIGFTGENNEDIINRNSNTLAYFKVNNKNTTITADYESGNHLVRFMLTEQNDTYNTQPLSFNGVVVRKIENGNSPKQVLNEDIITENFSRFLDAGTYSIVLITGRAEGIIKSPGLFLLSEKYSELPESAIINGATTAPVNGLELNRFNEINSEYVELNGENYSEIIFAVSEEEAGAIEIKLSFVPVYAVNENGITNNEIKSIADFGTMSEALNFENSDLRNKIDLNNSELKQGNDFKAKHVFNGLGEQPVFVRPVSTTLSNRTYDGQGNKIEDVNIFIGLHEGGGNFALFTDGIHKVSNLVVENITVVRGAEQNSTINDPVFIRHFTNLNNYAGRNEYKLKIGGVASGVNLLENITASNLHVELGKITTENQYGDLIESDVIAYVGGIAGITGAYGINYLTDKQDNILNSLFEGEILLTNTSGIVGGIAGLNISQITRSKSDATIVASGYVGGIAGENRGTTSFSTFSGSVQGYGVVGGVVGLNNSSHYDSRHPINVVKGNILEGSVKLLGANENQFAIWHEENAKETYNNYTGGFVGVSGLAMFESNYSNSNKTEIKGARIAPFIGLIDYKYPAATNTMFIRDNYFVSTENNVVNTNSNKIPALGYWININEINIDSNNLPFANTIISINKTNTNLVFENEYASAGLNKNNILYNEAELTETDDVFKDFVSTQSVRIGLGFTQNFEFKNSYEIINKENYELLIANQNQDYPFLNNGYKNDYNIKDRILISVYAYESGKLTPKSLDRNGIDDEAFANWTIEPLNITGGINLVSNVVGNYEKSMLIHNVVKFTKFEINVKKEVQDGDNTYFLKDHQMYFDYINRYGNPDNPQEVIDGNENNCMNENSFTLQYSNPNTTRGKVIVNDIKLHFVDKSTFELDLKENNALSGITVYDGTGFSKEYSYSYGENEAIKLTSKNKGIFTGKVLIKTEKIKSINGKAVEIDISEESVDVEGVGEKLYNNIEGLSLKIIKTINNNGYEELEIKDVNATGIYKLTISTESYMRISASITGIDEHLSSTTISKVEFVAVYKASYGSTVEVSLNEVYNNQLLDTVLETSLNYGEWHELHSIKVVANNRHNHEPRFAMTPANISVNNNLVYENEFNFNANVNSANNYYQNETMNGFIEIENYLTEISQNENSFNINVHFDYSKRGLRVLRPNEESTPFEHISLEYGYVADANNEFTQTLPILNVHDMFKVEEKGFTIRLTNLEKQTTPYNGIEFSESDNIYRVVGTNRFVRLLILLSETTSFNDYVEYDTFVRDYERNPNENDEGIILFTEPEFTIIPKAVSNLHLDINVYEIYEIDIKSGLSETSFGTASELTKNSMPIAKLNGNLNNSVILPTVQNTNVQLLNAYHSQLITDTETNNSKMLVEFGSQLKLTSSKDNVKEDIENERLIFEKWSISNEGKSFVNSNENLLESTPVRASHTYTAEYRFKTVEIYISRDIDMDKERGELSLPVPTLPDGTALDKSKVDTSASYATYLYEHNGRTIVTSMPNFAPKLFKLPTYDIDGNIIGGPNDLGHRFYTREITYGEKIKFVVTDFKEFEEDASLTGLRLGKYKFYSMPDNDNMEVTQEGLLNEEFGTDYSFEFDDETGRTASFSGRVLDSFIIKSDYITNLNTYVNYTIGNGSNKSGSNKVTYTNSQYLTDLTQYLDNVSSFSSYNRSDTEIRFNLTEIANKEGLDINNISAQWYVQMPKNYIPLIDGPPTAMHNTFGDYLDLETSETKNHILFETSLEVEDGDLYAVISYNATVLDYVEYTIRSGEIVAYAPWRTMLNDSINIRLQISNTN